ncbi:MULTISPECIES: CCA tRNA nucleotidyltransferase [Micromonospora]|uniref:CCA tRNA nucleotidyltransferase n=2 Tax=Micromonospora TaxID=1873 RepID=A0A9X0I4Z2_9ACTN|nr:MULTISPECIES: CCA tRNA nucleotidyltransferase [Micromonospora]AEB47956.1 polynucleotide adenylyltransferase/metal dependent phosphohydrolase [Micromonospora maris AB-18-032]KUJ46948.1 CCA tRNA nucleotidyltransferase [Micromonospora maris]RUL91578.1 CCA tRNA nucleotidyltransferase [Verrucosispora sp. FIM060022]GIJ18753.1 CCA tRNA nucleotidyltransferase [Micromonospora gifhornensis]
MSDAAASHATDRRELSAAQRNAVAELLRVSPVADELGRRFAAAGHELHLVGGSVRDALLGRLGEDLDFCTDAHPDQTLGIVRGWAEAIWETGREFGTIGCQRDGLRLEITTFRAESYDQVSRNPVVEYGTNLTEDLRRRDFTINAMAVSLPDHRFTDPYGGLADLAAKVVRTPGTPAESFGDDPLRMLRAARFAAQLRFAVHPDVYAAMTRMAADLDRITAERIRDEFTKLLCAADPITGLRLLVDTGLAERFLPELTGLKLEIDEHAQHKDVYEHTLTVVRNAISYEQDGPDFILRMAALMHDVGKPATKAVGSDGRVSFHHHEVVGARLTKARMKALRYPKDITAKVTALVALHLRFYGYGRGEWTDSAVRRYVTDAGDLLSRLHKLTRSDCTTRNRRKAAQLAADYDALEERIARIAAEEDLARVRPDLDGNAIMELLGVPPGPIVGQAWKYLKDLRLERGPLDRDTAEAELLRWAREQGIGS